MFLSKLRSLSSLCKTVTPSRLLSLQIPKRYASGGKEGGEECDKKGKDKEELLFDPRCSIAIITGGATGIGYAAACHLLCEGAKHVVLVGINRQEGQDAIHKLNGKFGKDKALFMDLDVTNECDWDNVYLETKKQLGFPDILFNNAGMMEDKKWSLSVDVNVKGVLLGCFMAFKHMGKDQDPSNHGGIIVNNSSVHGFDAFPGAPVYCCTKHAVIGITKSLGADFHLKRTGIRVCSLCPSATITDLFTGAKNRQLVPEYGEEAVRQMAALPQQEIGAVGQAFTYVVRYGISGDHYVIEANDCFHARPPPRQSFSVLKRSFK